MKRTWLVITVLALTAAFSGSALAQVLPPPVVDHFRCYIVPVSPVLAVAVKLQDQFDAAVPLVENINQLRIEHFCNPVQKTTASGAVTPIVNVNHHLTMFAINPQVAIARTVVVSNQFGQQTLSVADARVLAVPTGKGIPPVAAPPPPTDLDHYKCYAASGPALLNVVVNLKDQFLSENVRVLQPVRFCNPVRKNHNGVITGILHPNVHLTCYTTSTSQFPGTSINIQNQFGLFNALGVRPPDLLCVPSLKLSWSVVTGTTPTTPDGNTTPQ